MLILDVVFFILVIYFLSIEKSAIIKKLNSINKKNHSVFRLIKKIESDYFIVENISLKDNEKKYDIDMLLITEKNIYVIERKNIKEIISGTERQEYWTQEINKGINYKFINPILKNKNNIIFLKKYLNIPDYKYFNSIIAFSEECNIDNIKYNKYDTTICREKDIVKIINEKEKSIEERAFFSELNTIKQKLCES